MDLILGQIRHRKAISWAPPAVVELIEGIDLKYLRQDLFPHHGMRQCPFFNDDHEFISRQVHYSGPRRRSLADQQERLLHHSLSDMLPTAKASPPGFGGPPQGHRLLCPPEVFAPLGCRHGHQRRHPGAHGASLQSPRSQIDVLMACKED